MGQPFPASHPPLHLAGLHNCRQWEDTVISKTPVWLLDFALNTIADHDYVIESFDLAHLVGLALDHAYLIGGTLNHQADPQLCHLAAHNCHQPLEEYVNLRNKGNHSPPPTVILYIPSCNVFFSVFAPMASNTIHGLDRPI
jgi:hypothetical protein